MLGQSITSWKRSKPTRRYFFPSRGFEAQIPRLAILSVLFFPPPRFVMLLRLGTFTMIGADLPMQSESRELGGQ